MIVSTFGPEGPTRCSGLEVVRYDAESLHQEFGVRFRLLDSRKEMYRTPFGTVQQFLILLLSGRAKLKPVQWRRYFPKSNSGRQHRAIAPKRIAKPIRFQPFSPSGITPTP